MVRGSIRSMNSKLILVALFPMVLCGCQDDTFLEDANPSLPNRPPKAFDVFVTKVSSEDAVLAWGPVYDPDGDPLYHKVYLNGEPVTGILQRDSIVKLVNLKSKTTYSGEVVVTDSINAPVSHAFSFETLKYFLRYDRTFDRFNQAGVGTSMRVLEDGGLFIVGTATLYNYDALYITRTDSLGYKQWTNIIPSAANPNFIPRPVLTFHENDYYIAHSASINRVNSSGELVWQHLSDAGFIWGYMNVIVTDDHELLALGVERGSGNPTLSRFTLSGELIWERPVETELDVRPQQIVQSHEPGKYLILGTTESHLSLTQIDGDGVEDWTRLLIDDRLNFPSRIKILDSGYIIVGDSWGEYNVSAGRAVRLDRDANVLWDIHFLGPGTDTDFNSVHETRDGGFVIVGQDGNYEQDGLLIKLSPTGDILCKRFFSPDYLDYRWLLFDVVETSDGGFAMCGIKNYTWSDYGKELGMWLVKVDDMGQ